MMESKEAMHYVENAAIPLQIRLHESEVTTLPAPSSVWVMGKRNGYLPLLLPYIKPLFKNALPPGDDSVWFDYKGLPLKWYIPIGVLFDLLCAVPERPWHLTVHFRGYPQELFSPCDNEDHVKHSFMNSLKEAAYVINGNCKVIMNMSQFDQQELWRCVLKGEMEGYHQVATKLKLGSIAELSAPKAITNSEEARQTTDEINSAVRSRLGRIPVRLYIRHINQEFIEDEEFTEDVPPVTIWNEITYMNKPIEIQKFEGEYFFSLRDALESILPVLFNDHKSQVPDGATMRPESEDNTSRCNDSESADSSLQHESTSGPPSAEDHGEVVLNRSTSGLRKAKAELIRIQGIEPRLDSPFAWVYLNLMHPEHYLHICLYISGVERPT